jgi:predicted metalloprotease
MLAVVAMMLSGNPAPVVKLDTMTSTKAQKWDGRQVTTSVTATTPIYTLVGLTVAVSVRTTWSGC